jgi:hypothetical protein
MRLSTAWAKTAAQNVTLKVATIVLATVVVVQLIIIGQVSTKDPLVVDRSCFTRIVQAKASDPTPDEIRSFILQALPMRFDSRGALVAGFLSIDETTQREKELGQLKQRQMEQRMIVAEVKVDGNSVSVSADRLISIGSVKSALPLNLNVTLEQTNRSESNPYGLIITTITQVQPKEKKQ